MRPAAENAIKRTYSHANRAVAAELGPERKTVLGVGSPFLTA